MTIAGQQCVKDIEDLDDGVEAIDVSVLVSIWNPFSAWYELKGKAITEEEVQSCIANGDEENVFTELFLPTDSPTEIQVKDARENHIKKIAYFVVHGFSDPIDVECLDYDDFRVNDGNHRLCAAIIRGEKAINGWVGGFLDCAYDAKLILEADDVSM